MVLSLSVWGAVRFAAALRWWEVLSAFDARLSPLYLSITGAGWVVAGVVLLFGMWTAKAWARPATLVSLPLWLAMYWVERLFFQAERANLPFALTCSTLALIVVFVSARNRNTKLFFTRSEEHEQPSEDPIPE
jgi:uncharacterized membrane protein